MMIQTSRSGCRALQLLLYLALILAGFELYHAISAVSPRQIAPAHRHAAALVDLERRLGIFFEPGMQHAVMRNASGAGGGAVLARWLEVWMPRVYSTGQMPWLVCVLCWLYLFRRAYFKRICVAAILTSLAAILFAAIYPVAPPRFALAGGPYWMQDLTGVPGSEQALVHRVGFNPYASLPSIHVLWALLTGLGLWYGAPSRWARLPAVVFPCVVAASVVVTGNHYVLDCLAAGVLLGAYLLAQEGCLRLSARLQPGQRIGRFIGGVRAGERRHRPELRPLDSPLLICAGASCVLLEVGDGFERLLGLGTLCAGAGALLWVRRAVANMPLKAEAPYADWFCGMLLVAGATGIVADQESVRVTASLFWAAAAGLPLWARLRGAVRKERMASPGGAMVAARKGPALRLVPGSGAQVRGAWRTPADV